MEKTRSEIKNAFGENAQVYVRSNGCEVDLSTTFPFEQAEQIMKDLGFTDNSKRIPSSFIKDDFTCILFTGPNSRFVKDRGKL